MDKGIKYLPRSGLVQSFLGDTVIILTTIIHGVFEFSLAKKGQN